VSEGGRGIRAGVGEGVGAPTRVSSSYMSGRATGEGPQVVVAYMFKRCEGGVKCVSDEVSLNALEALEDGDFQRDLGVSLYLSSTRRGLFVEFLEEFWGIEVTVVDPAIVSGWVPFLMDEVLEFTSSSVSSCISNVLYFIFFVILLRHRGWSDIVRAIR
jgi:hypothetical protein